MYMIIVFLVFFLVLFMKWALWIASLLSSLLLLSPVFAQVQDDQLLDAVWPTTQTIDYDQLQLREFTSCDEMQQVLQDFVSGYIKEQPYPIMPYGRWWWMLDDVALDGAQAVSPESDQTNEVRSSVRDGFSQTNLQKEWIDEPDILKTDGRYLYYYNSKAAKIQILESPYDPSNSLISLDKAHIVSEINIPSSLSNIDLILYEKQLIIVAYRYSDRVPLGHLQRNDRTAVVRYDISHPTSLSLLSYQEFDGAKNDIRLDTRDGTLYVMTNLSFNRRYGINSYASDLKVSLRTNELLPKTITVTNTNGTLSSTVVPADCKRIRYLLPNKDQLSSFGQWPSFTTINAIQLSHNTTHTQVIFGQPAQIHMSEKGLFLAQSLYMPQPFRCPPNVLCAEPLFWGGESHTLIHGFSLWGSEKLSYTASNLIAGSPLYNQYSMDEYEWSFRIITQTWHTQQSTNLYILNEKLQLVWKLTNIEPGESFQGARFMGNKLYLVTFQQIDPLFVIDISNRSSPQIIGQLKMPGYSNYLHPLWLEHNGIQYLLGLGYDTDVNQWWGTRTAWLKIDVYKVNYLQKETANSLCGSLSSDGSAYASCIKTLDPTRMRVEQLDSITLGQEGSYSPVLDNPRLFVMDDDNTLILPVLLTDTTPGKKQCTTNYDAQGAIISQDCYDYDQTKTSFVWLKSFHITTNTTAAINETRSLNYIDAFSTHYPYELYGHVLNDLGSRVGYAGDVVYMITNLFVDFVVGKTHKTIALD